MSLFSVFHSRRMFLDENVMLQGLGILFCDLQCNSKQCGFNPTEQPQNPGDLCINACIYTSVLSFWSVDQCAELVVLGPGIWDPWEVSSLPASGCGCCGQLEAELLVCLGCLQGGKENGPGWSRATIESCQGQSRLCMKLRHTHWAADPVPPNAVMFLFHVKHENSIKKKGQ